MTVIGGFLLIGSPSHIRSLRYDQQRVSDLQSIQAEVVNYWQQKRALPESLDALNDQLSGFSVPSQPNAAGAYEYRAMGAAGFELCATFEAPSEGSTRTYLDYPSIDQNFNHGAGPCLLRAHYRSGQVPAFHACFESPIAGGLSYGTRIIRPYSH